jgi:hypothetical protein
MNFDEIQQAARAFGQQYAQQTQGHQPGEAMPGFQQDPTYLQAQQLAKAQIPVQQVPQQPVYAQVPQPVQQYQPVQYQPVPQPVPQPVMKAQPVPQQQQPVQQQVPQQQQPVQQQVPQPAPQMAPPGVTQQAGWQPITNDTFQKAIAVFDQEFVPDGLRSEPVQKAIEQDATGFLNGITDRFEQAVANLAKAQNTRTSALSVVLLKAVEDIEAVRAQVAELARAPMADPRGRRMIAPQPQTAPMQKAFPSAQPGQEGFFQQQPGQMPQGAPVNEQLTKAQINTGFALLIQEAGQAYDENPSLANRAKLDRVGVESGNFPFTGMVNPGTKGEIYKALQANGLLHYH